MFSVHCQILQDLGVLAAVLKNSFFVLNNDCDVLFHGFLIGPVVF